MTESSGSSSSIDIRTADGGTGGTVELPADVFDVAANIPLMHQVVVAQLAAARQGTHDTKTRGEVAGGGGKPYRQKGTGRARQGSIRAPQFVGGGVAHGPTPRDYAQRTPKKMKVAALRSALSDRARAGLVHVVSGLVEGDTPSTKVARRTLATIASGPRVLVVLPRADEVTRRSLRNLPAVHVLSPDQLNTYDVLVNDEVVFTTEALRTFLAGPASTRPAAAPERSAELSAARALVAESAARGDTQPRDAGPRDVQPAEEEGR
ncbi:MAG TPA: 50S ribosomal protein L4 [Pseudonocardiaceae bacterium]|jgi:large subunit ribosomal protein L4|nr:50S ribosomal protein L4 [Pseudonocardiaceae bacterium]